MNICQFKPFIGEKEYESIKECFDFNWITEGPKSEKFVKRLCELLNVKYGVLAPNGTLSLYLGLKAIDIRCRDEVIVPNFTFIASANSIQMCGAIPRFCDITDDLQIDINDCERLITEKTKAIMPVHVYGIASNMDKVCEFAKKHNLKIIEDAAQGINVFWNNKHTGTFGDVGSFSFFADKTITTGEGGFVCTNNEEIYKKLQYLRNQGRINRGSFIHPEIGYNFRMTDIQCAIGLTQLNKLNIIVENKLRILSKYKELLKDNIHIKIIEPLNSLSNHLPFRVCIITLNELNDRLSKYLNDNGIETRTFFHPLHKQPYYHKMNENLESQLSDNYFKKSIYYYEHGLCLPSFPELKDEEIKYICNLISLLFKK
jgi:perosamine synthetase